MRLTTIARSKNIKKWVWKSNNSRLILIILAALSCFFFRAVLPRLCTHWKETCFQNKRLSAGSTLYRQQYRIDDRNGPPPPRLPTTTYREDDIGGVGTRFPSRPWTSRRGVPDDIGSVLWCLSQIKDLFAKYVCHTVVFAGRVWSSSCEI